MFGLNPLLTEEYSGSAPEPPDVSVINADREERLEVFQAMMPEDLANAHYTENILKCFTYELALVEMAMDYLTSQMHIGLATGKWLRKWELLLDLVGNPEDFTEPERRNRIASQLTGRFEFYGRDFIRGLGLLAGVEPVATVDPTNGTALLYFPTGLTPLQIDQILYYCTTVGPAHYEWEIDSDNSGSGFVVNESTVGFTKI